MEKIVYKYSPTILNEFGLDTATGPPACSAVLMSDLLCLSRKMTHRIFWK